MTTTEITAQLAIELDMDADALKKEVEKVMSRGSAAQSAVVSRALTKPEYDNLRASMYDREFTSGEYACAAAK